MNDERDNEGDQKVRVTRCAPSPRASSRCSRRYVITPATAATSIATAADPSLDSHSHSQTGQRVQNERSNEQVQATDREEPSNASNTEKQTVLELHRKGVRVANADHIEDEIEVDGELVNIDQIMEDLSIEGTHDTTVK